MISSHASRLFTALRSPFPFIAGVALVCAACSDQTAPVDPIDESVDGIAEIQDLPEFHRGWGNPVVRLALARAVLTEVQEIEVPGIGVVQPAFSGMRTHSFVAYQRQDDAESDEKGARGWTRLNQRGNEGSQSVYTRGRVVCMNKLEDANLVLIADETTQRSGDPVMGSPFAPPPTEDDDGTVWAIRDNGRGPLADPDQITFRISTLKAVAKGICQAPPAQLVGLAQAILLEIERGFIKVIG